MSDIGWLIVAQSINVQPFYNTSLPFFCSFVSWHQLTKRQWHHSIEVKLIRSITESKEYSADSILDAGILCP